MTEMVKQVPDYATDQELSYLQSRGFGYRDFTAEQVQDELSRHGIKSAEDYLNFQNHPQKLPAIELGVTYEHISQDRYEKMGLKLIRSTSIAGGFVYAKPNTQASPSNK